MYRDREAAGVLDPEPAAVEAEGFEDFFLRCEPRVRAALTARYGPEHGRDAAAEALAWAYEHWDRAQHLEHPVAYLYRVGQSRTRRSRRRTPLLRVVHDPHSYEFDPRVPAALAALAERQRVAVLLVHGHDWPTAEVAALLGVSASTVSTHLARGLEALRTALEDRDDIG
jgi:RNA polymerase sigma factor (sigma-70 family)